MGRIHHALVSVFSQRSETQRGFTKDSYLIDNVNVLQSNASCHGETAIMKVLMISDVYFPRINGVSTSILTFRRELSLLGHEVALIAPKYEQSIGEVEDDILRVPSHRVLFDPEDRLMKVRDIHQLTTSLANWKPDVVHVQTPFMAHYAGLALARRLHLPCVASYHTFFEEYLFHYLPFAPKDLMRYAARHFSRSQGNALDALVVPSQAIAKILYDYGVQTPTRIIPTGVNPTDLQGGDGVAFRHRREISTEQPLVLYVGRLAFEKKIDFLLQVIRQVRTQVPNVLLVIAGDGPAREHLERLVARLDIRDNVRFVGYLARHGELRDAYRAADAFAFASDTETQGLVLLEAMASGLPIVSTAELGTWDILQAGQGALVAQRDVTDFSSKLTQLLQDTTLRDRLSKEGRAYAQQWTAQTMAVRMAEFYREVKDLRRGCAPHALHRFHKLL